MENNPCSVDSYLFVGGFNIEMHHNGQHFIKTAGRCTSFRFLLFLAFCFLPIGSRFFLQEHLEDQSDAISVSDCSFCIYRPDAGRGCHNHDPEQLDSRLYPQRWNFHHEYLVLREYLFELDLRIYVPSLSSWD